MSAPSSVPRAPSEGSETTGVCLGTDIPGLTKIYAGKMRDLYRVPGREGILLIVTTDRQSYMDRNLGFGVPGKGPAMVALSRMWFGLTASLVPNHCLPPAEEAALFEATRVTDHVDASRCMFVREAVPVRVEAVARGYLVGALWQAYSAAASGGPDGDEDAVTVWGHRLPRGLRHGQALPEPLFTPSTKAPLGSADEYMSLDAMRAHLDAASGEAGHGRFLDEIGAATLALYGFMRGHAAARGLVLADAKVEFGVDRGTGKLVLMDEVGTPDCARLWYADAYPRWLESDPPAGTFPPGPDRQAVANYLTSIRFRRDAPLPVFPPDLIAATAHNYREATRILTGPPLSEQRP
jgi:phosphoribosylaminoimidazole-succinocarboxamide synthase